MRRGDSTAASGASLAAASSLKMSCRWTNTTLRRAVHCTLRSTPPHCTGAAPHRRFPLCRRSGSHFFLSVCQLDTMEASLTSRICDPADPAQATVVNPHLVAARSRHGLEGPWGGRHASESERFPICSAPPAHQLCPLSGNRIGSLRGGGCVHWLRLPCSCEFVRSSLYLELAAQVVLAALHLRPHGWPLSPVPPTARSAAVCGILWRRLPSVIYVLPTSKI